MMKHKGSVKKNVLTPNMRLNNNALDPKIVFSSL